MKKMITPLLIAAMLIPGASCIDEIVREPEFPETAEAEVVLRFRTPGGFSGGAQTRSLTFDEENTINDAFVLAFDKNGRLAAIRQGQNITSASGHAGPAFSGEGSFSVTLAASAAADDTYNLVVLANAQAILEAAVGTGDASAFIGMDYADVYEAISGEIDGKMFVQGGAIPMWGESGAMIVEQGSGARTLQLTRAVARIDVGVGRPSKDPQTDAWTWDGEDAAGNPIPFRLAHVYVMRPNNRYAVVPDAAASAGNPTVPAGAAAFTAAQSESAFRYDAAPAAAGGCSSRDIYVPEADVRMGVTAKPGDANHASRMAVVVGGYYNGSPAESFYRLDFAIGSTLVNALRNHLYQFNISGVTGTGYADVATAYNSLAVNMAADIADWDENDFGEIVFDGQHFLSVSKGSFTFNRAARTASSGDNRLRIKTDVPGGWAIDRITDNATGLPAAWLTIDAAEQSGTDETVSLLLSANTTASARSAKLHIIAGRLDYAVGVAQTTEQPGVATVTPATVQLTLEAHTPAGRYLTVTSLKQNGQIDNEALWTLEVPPTAQSWLQLTLDPAGAAGLSSAIAGQGMQYVYLVATENNDDARSAHLTLNGVHAATVSQLILEIGTPGNPIMVNNADDLRKVGSGDDGWALNLYYEQTAAIDLAAIPDWAPIAPSAANAFTGTYDGGGFAIQNLAATAAGRNYCGLFGYVGAGGTVINVRLDGAGIAAGDYAGGVAGYNMGTLESCYVNDIHIAGANYIGGVAGANYGTVKYCCATNADISGNDKIGGITGMNFSGSIVEYCFAAGGTAATSVAGSTGRVAGGITGENRARIQNCYAAINVNGYQAGGVAGLNSNIINCCYATGNISSRSRSGGVSGYNTSVVQNCAGLNKSVITTENNPAVIARVTTGAGTALTNNHGRTGMTVQFNHNGSTGNNIAIQDNPSGGHGANASEADYHSSAWWSGTVGFSTQAWSLANNLLPRLKGFPGVVQNPAVTP